MASNINPNIPVQGTPVASAPIRANFAAAASEITALQNSTAPVAAEIGALQAQTNSTIITATDQTSLLLNSRQLIAGTNVTLNTATPGQIIISSNDTDTGITQLTGDVTAGPGSGTQSATLATVNGSVGSFTNASITVNGKGLITAASSGTAPVTSISGTPNRITITGTVTPQIDIAATYVGQTSITTLGTIGTGVWNAGAVTSSGAVQGTTLASTIAIGTPPLAVTSTTLVPNLYVARAVLADTATTSTTATNVILANDASDATSFPVFSGTATGNQPLKTNAGFTFDATTANLGSTIGTFGTLNSGTGTITSSSTNALTVGRQGATNPAFQVDASAATSVTGLKVSAAALAGGVTLQGITSGTNEALSIFAAGTGNVFLGANVANNITIGGNSSSGVQIGRMLLTGSNALFPMVTVNNTAATIRFSVTNGADAALTASTEAPYAYFNLSTARTHAAGAIALQRDFRITGTNHAFASASTITDDAVFSVDGPVSGGTNATLTNSHGIYIPTAAVTNVTNAYGISVNAPTGGSGINAAANFGGDIRVTGTTSGIVLPSISAPSYTQGKLVYDGDNQCMTFFNNDSNVSLQVGQEEWVRVQNNTGSTIANGAAVTITGAASGLPTVALAQANTGIFAVGLATEAIANGTSGWVTTYGIVNGLNTLAFSAGATVFVDPTTPGALTTTAPTSPNYRIRMGTIGVSSATVGTIFVSSPTTGLGFGTANQIMGMNNAATGQEYKTIAGTSNEITITQGVGTITASIPTAVTFTGKTITGGTYNSPTLVTPALGTPASGNLSNCTGYTVANISGLGTGVATWLATPSSANLVAAITDETGSGSLVFATSPTLVTPLLGTPTSANLINCTGYTVGNLAGLGTGVGTFLATPSSANLIAAVTDETGSGALVFGTAPTFTTGITTPKVTFSNTATGGIVGTTTNDSAAAGFVGEFVSATVLIGSAVSLTSTIAGNVTSISLTAGDWDVHGNVLFNPAGTTTYTEIAGWISSTSATLPTLPNSGGFANLRATIPAGFSNTIQTGTIRISIATTTTIFLEAYANFSVSTMSAYGFIGARRVR